MNFIDFIFYPICSYSIFIFLFFSMLRVAFSLHVVCEFCVYTVADPENFGGGGFEAKTSKIRMSSPKLRVIFRPKSEIQTFFSPKIRLSPKKKKKKGLHQN